MHNTELSSKGKTENLKVQEVLWEPAGRTVSEGDAVSQSALA